MAKILLDYVFPVTVIEPTPQASTAYLKQACVVCKPKAGQEGNVGQVFECTTMTAVAVRTDNSEAQQLFNAGMDKVFILLSDDLDIADALDANQNDFYTVLISSDFADADLTAVAGSAAVPEIKSFKKIEDILYTSKLTGTAGDDISVTYVDDGAAGAETIDLTVHAIVVHMEAGASTADNIRDAIEADSGANALVLLAVDVGDETDVQAAHTIQTLSGGQDAVAAVPAVLALTKGTFKGVVGFSSSDEAVCSDFAAVVNQCGFFRDDSNGAKNMLFAFGSLLSNLSDWLNQQYITMPFDDGVDVLGDATTLFDDKVSFALNDDEFGNRLALFAAGGKAIIAPYILKNLSVDLQSRSLQWISGNEPQYTKKEAALLETRLQEDVVNLYVSRRWIESGTVEITLEEQNFVATGDIEVPQPKALWRVFSELRETV